MKHQPGNGNLRFLLGTAHLMRGNLQGAKEQAAALKSIDTALAKNWNSSAASESCNLQKGSDAIMKLKAHVSAGILILGFALLLSPVRGFG